MFALYKKELQFYLNNPIGYIILGLFGVFANFLFVKDVFVVGSASMKAFFDILPWLTMIVVPALAMRSFAEEKRTNTLEVLLSLPISETQIVLAKFLAYLTLFALGLALTFVLPVSLYILSGQVGARISLIEVFIGYLGELMLASLAIALSMLFSVKTSNQVVALLSSILVLFFLIVLSTDFVAGFLPLMIQQVLSYLSPITQLESFIKGLLDLRSVYYFISFTAVCLFLTIIDLERRK